MEEINLKFRVPKFLEGVAHLPTTIPGVVLLVAPHVINYYWPGTFSVASEVISSVTGFGLVGSTGDTKPPKIMPPV